MGHSHCYVQVAREVVVAEINETLHAISHLPRKARYLLRIRQMRGLLWIRQKRG
jgi:hypothetical protein